MDVRNVVLNNKSGDTLHPQVKSSNIIDLAQTTGQNPNAVMSQKATTDAINNLVVDLPIALTTRLGVVKSSVDDDKIFVNADGTMTVNSINLNKVKQTTGDVLILENGSSE